MRTFIRKKIPLSFEIAPLVDIVFLLLVFFLLTSISSQNLTRLDLPKSTATKKAQKAISVCITKQEKIFVNGRKVEMESLLPFLRSILEGRKNKIVNIEAYASLPFRIPVRVMDICRMAGAERISIVTQEENR